jgi:hypothetical protein
LGDYTHTHTHTIQKYTVNNKKTKTKTKTKKKMYSYTTNWLNVEVNRNYTHRCYGLFMVAALVFDHLTSKSVLRHSIE